MLWLPKISGSSIVRLVEDLVQEHFATSYFLLLTFIIPLLHVNVLAHDEDVITSKVLGFILS